MPGDWSVIYDEALGLHRRGQYADALSLLREAEEPGIPKLEYMKMRCFIKLEMVREALACCEVLDTTFHDPRVAVLFQQFRDEGVSADKDILRELTLLCAYEHASRLFRQHEYLEALDVLEEVGGRTNAELVYARARCLSKLGRFDEALESCRELDDHYGDPRAEELVRKIEKSQGIRKQVLPPLEIPTQDFESAAPQAPNETFVEPQPNQQEMDYWDAVQREAQHEAQVASLQGQVTTLSGEKEELGAGESDAAAALEDARAECSRLRDALNERESARAEAEQREAEHAAAIGDLRKRADAAAADLDALRAKLTESEQALSAACEDRDRVRRMLEERDAMDSDASGREAEHAAAMGELRERADAAAADLDALRAKLTETEQALSAACEDRDRVRRMLEERDTADSDASRREAEQEMLIASLRAQVETLDGEAKRLQAVEQAQARSLEEAHAECDRLKESSADVEAQAAEKIARFATQVALLEGQLKAAMADVEQLRVQEDSLAAKVGGVRAERDKLKKELEELQCASAESAQQIETLGARIASLEAQLKAKADETEEARAGGQSSAVELEQARLACERLQSEVAERDAAAARAAQREADFEASIATLRAQADAMSASAEQSRMQEDARASELAGVRAEREHLEEQLRAFEQAAEEALQSDSMNAALVTSLQEQLKAAGDDGSAARANADRIAAELEGLRSERDRLKQALDEHADAVAQSSQREAKLQAFSAFLKEQFDAAKAEIEQGVVEAARKDEELEDVRAERERLKGALDGRDVAATQAAEREANLEALVLSLQQHVEKLSAKVHELESIPRAPVHEAEPVGEAESAEECPPVETEPDAELQELASETETLLAEASAVAADAAARATPPPPVKTEEERRQERKESQDKLRAGQLRFLFPTLRPGISTREVLKMYGEPTRVEDAEDPARVVQAPRAGGILGRVFGESGGGSAVWVYDSPPWGSVRLEVVDKIVLRIHWEI